jgi:chromosome condensin MukBEF MukE localization factor
MEYFPDALTGPTRQKHRPKTAGVLPNRSTGNKRDKKTMKNQNIADINDYRKFGLVRTLSDSGKIRIDVCWMLTPDKTGSR